MNRLSIASLAIGLALLMEPWPSRGASCSAGYFTGTAALLSGWADDVPGRCRRLRPADIVQPAASNTSFSSVIEIPAGALPRVPPGFSVALFHRGVDAPRLIRAAPNGDIFVAESLAGQLRILRPAGTCQLGGASVYATGLDRPFGIAFYPPGPNPQYVYVAENSRIIRYPYLTGDLVPSNAMEVIVPALPQGAGQLPGQGHWTRDVAFSADGSTMFVAVGSCSNAQEQGEDETERAAILAFNPDGSNRRVFASGLRNPVSLSVSPRNGALWASVNERDGLGDELVPDYLTAVDQGQFFGWPWFYIGGHRDPRPAVAPPAGLPEVTVPTVLLQAHAASLGSAFYSGTQFPAGYRGNLFVAQHGSWNRANPTGSKVIRVPFTWQGRAIRRYEDFMTGFVMSNHQVWGRPVGIAMGADGSLYVSEDASNAVYCVSYTG